MTPEEEPLPAADAPPLSEWLSFTVASEDRLRLDREWRRRRFSSRAHFLRELLRSALDLAEGEEEADS